MTMLSQLPNDLLMGAYQISNGEAAWPRDDALKVIRWATASRVAVFGAEIWIPTTPGPTIPTPYIYTFEPKQIADEEWTHFVGRANKEVAAYFDCIRHFR